MAKGRKEVVKDSEEFDAITGWRHLLNWPRGALKKVKRRLNKRQRKKMKEDLRHI